MNRTIPLECTSVGFSTDEMGKGELDNAYYKFDGCKSLIVRENSDRAHSAAVGWWIYTLCWQKRGLTVAGPGYTYC